MADNDNPVDRDSSGLDPQSFLTDSQNRRTFLKAAVVGTAAVAAVGGAGTAALALSGRKPASLLSFTAAQPTPSPEDPCAVCTTGTNPDNFTDEDTFGNNSLFLWVRFINVAAGSYTIDVTPTILPSTASGCVSATPFQYQSPHNSVTSWTFPAGGRACHPAKLADWPGGTGSDSLPASFTIAAPMDLAVQVHLQGMCSGTFTVTGLLKSGDTTVLSCTHQITINLQH